MDSLPLQQKCYGLYYADAVAAPFIGLVLLHCIFLHGDFYHSVDGIMTMCIVDVC